MTDDDLAPIYPAHLLDVLDVPVVALGPGYAMDAVLRRHDGHGRYWWHRLDADGKVTPFAQWPAGKRSPEFWRPKDLISWPAPLPEPHVSLSIPSPPDFRPPRGEPEPLPDMSDGWPHPRVKLGDRTPPVSRDECEARLLRALRTSASSAVSSIHRPRRTICGDLPSEWVKAALAHAEAERLSRLIERVGSDFEAVRSGWTPNKRDINDWDYALIWLRGVDGAAARVLKWRSFDPPFSFSEIGDRLGGRYAERGEHDIGKTRVRRLYTGTLDVIFRAVGAKAMEAA